MTPEEQEARSLKFEPKASVTLRQLSTGNFALYPLGGVGSPFWIGPLSDLASAYAARPAYVPHRGAPSTVPIGRPKAIAGINLSSLEIDL